MKTVSDVLAMLDHSDQVVNSTQFTGPQVAPISINAAGETERERERETETETETETEREREKERKRERKTREEARALVRESFSCDRRKIRGASWKLFNILVVYPKT